MVILIFGDSITQGYWDEQGGWADRVKRYVMEKDIKQNFKDYHSVFNLGVDSNITHNIIERFDNEVNARRFPGADAKSDYGVIFAIGVNDALHIGKRFQSSPEQYRKELIQLLRKTKELTSRIAFVNLLPIDEGLEAQVTAGEDLFYTNDRIELFNNVLEQFCKENELGLIDIRSLFMKDLSLLSADSTHPNTKGHEIIYSLLIPTIESWLSAT